MGKKVQDVQTIINKRASDKLNADLVAMSKIIDNIPLLRDMHDGQRPLIYDRQAPSYGDKPEAVYKEFAVPHIFSASMHRDELNASNWMKRLREYWLTEYIQRETLDFFQRLDKIENDVNELMDAKSQVNDY